MTPSPLNITKSHDELPSTPPATSAASCRNACVVYVFPLLMVGLVIASYLGQISMEAWTFRSADRNGMEEDPQHVLDMDAPPGTIEHLLDVQDEDEVVIVLKPEYCVGANGTVTIKTNEDVMDTEKGTRTQKDEKTAVICLVQREEEAYIDEWVDFHLGLGFSDIYIYNNDDEQDLEIMKEWQEQRKDPRIHLIPFPGHMVQDPVYKDCATRVREYGHTWVMFIDVDEFLVLKKDNNIVDFAQHYVPSGHLALNWELFGTSGHKKYEKGYPVTQRFQCVYGSSMNRFTKSLIKVVDLEPIKKIRSPHSMPVRPGALRIDTNGNEAPGSQHKGPRDVAVINHYVFKSHEEYIHKRERGDVFFGNANHREDDMLELAKHGMDQHHHPIPAGDLQDSLAWDHLKRMVPEYYEKYEKDGKGPKEPFHCTPTD